jgi:hypothetical protein
MTPLVRHFYEKLSDLDDRLDQAETAAREVVDAAGCREAIRQAERIPAVVEFRRFLKELTAKAEKHGIELPCDPSIDAPDEFELSQAGVYRNKLLGDLPPEPVAAMQRVWTLHELIEQIETEARRILSEISTPEEVADEVAAIFGIDAGDNARVPRFDDWVLRLWPPAELDWMKIRNADAVIAIYRDAQITLWQKPKGGPNVMRIPVSTKPELRHVIGIVEMVDRRRGEDWK